MPWANPAGQAAVNGGSVVSKEYVDAQDAITLVSAKLYVDGVSEGITANIGGSVSETVSEAVSEAIAMVTLEPEEI